MSSQPKSEHRLAHKFTAKGEFERTHHFAVELNRSLSISPPEDSVALGAIDLFLGVLGMGRPNERASVRFERSWTAEPFRALRPSIAAESHL
jgi:hypothetical protein